MADDAKAGAPPGSMSANLTFIGLMKKAGALAIGAENGYDSARMGKAKILCLASDAARNTVDGAHNALAEGRAILVKLPYNKRELGAALGQQECAALAVTDLGFALSLCQKLGLESETHELSARLEREKRRKAKKRKTSSKGDRV